MLIFSFILFYSQLTVRYSSKFCVSLLLKPRKLRTRLVCLADYAYCIVFAKFPCIRKYLRERSFIAVQKRTSFFFVRNLKSLLKKNAANPLKADTESNGRNILSDKLSKQTVGASAAA